MNKQSGALAIILSFLSWGILHAQERKTLDLQEAINLSLRNSKQLKYSQAKIDQATAELKEAVERRLPDAKLSGSWMWLSNANIDIKTKTNNGNQGGSPSVSQAMYGMLNASLPIYAGGRIRYGIESSRYLAEAARLDADNDRQSVIQNTIEAYVNLYKAKSSVSIVLENLNEAQQRVKDFSNLEKNGLLARNDLLKAELQASNVELALLDAQNNWKLANVNMTLLLGLPESTEIIPASTMIDQTFAVKTLDEYVQAAFTQRKDMASQDLRKKAAETGVKASRADYYPSIAFTSGYVAADIPRVLTITNAVTVGAGINYNIGSLWKAKSRIQQAEAKATQAAIGQSMLDDQIRLQINQAYSNFLSSQKKIEVYTKAIEQANENYKIVSNKYNNSLATTTELLDADVARLQASMNFIFAKADAVVAYNHLLQAAGILDEYKKQQ